MQPIAGSAQGVVWPAALVRGTLPRMKTKTKTVMVGVVMLISLAALNQTASAPASDPQYTSDGKMKLPENYREWIYLSTGIDMSYSPAARAAGADHHMFDNVFVNPSSYKAFKETGTWPDKTILVLEVRGAQSKGSINQRGNFQTDNMMALEG